MEYAEDARRRQMMNLCDGRSPVAGRAASYAGSGQLFWASFIRLHKVLSGGIKRTALYFRMKKLGISRFGKDPCRRGKAVMVRGLIFQRIDISPSLAICSSASGNLIPAPFISWWM
jgi:hypothetical protein